MATTKVTKGVIADNAVSIDQLDVTDGSNGQVLSTNGSGTLSFTSVTSYSDSDVETYLDGGTSTPTFSSATVTGNLNYGTLNDGTTALTSTVAELNYLDGVTGITLGSANELLVVGGDGSSIASDSTLAVDTGNNRLGINQSSPEVTLHMTGEGAQTAQIRMEQYNDSADAPDVRTRRYRGTIASPSAISSGDYLFRSNHEYYNGSALIVGGQFAFDNTNNANRTQFTVAVTTDGTSVEASSNDDVQFKIDGNDSGAITFNNAYKFPTTDGTANQVLSTDGSGTLSFADGGVAGIVSSADATAITIDSSENVGIGTNSPAAPLDVVSNSSAIGIDLRGRSSDNIGQLSFESNDSATTYSQIQSRSTELLVKTIANIPMSFHTNNTERMRVLSTGNVGIDTTNPLTKFVVSNGGAEGVEFIPGAGGNINYTQHYNRSNSNWVDNRQYANTHSFHSGATEIARITGSGITFNGDTAAANALDDYEEGTHTPTITCSTSGTVTLNSDVDDLNYVKIGRMVHVQGMLTISSVSSPSGYFTVSLPFNIGSWGGTYAGRGTGSIWVSGGTSNNVADYIVLLIQGESGARVYLGDNTGPQSDSANNLGLNDDIYVGLTYLSN